MKISKMNLLNNEHFCETIYSALEKDETDDDYLANVAMAAFNVIENESIRITKSDAESNKYREEGNLAFQLKTYQRALLFYNKALAYAPNTSNTLKAAYYNRSVLFFDVKQYQACKKDCETALAINCPTPIPKLTEKLEKLRLRARQNFRSSTNNQKDKAVFREYADDYFKLKNRHDDIPCARNDVDVVFESGIPKVIAKRDIPVGTLVAIEKAFVSSTFKETEDYFCCYYCRKIDLNLFPCTSCVVALFCSKQCEETCMKEYHSVECEIVGNLPLYIPAKKWMVTAIIKLRNMCSSWEELIALSYKSFDGKDTLKINEICDSNNPSSLMCIRKDLHFIHGAAFNHSVMCAVILNVLQNLPFLPQDEVGKLSALKAMARIMMCWLYYTPMPMTSVSNVVKMEGIVAQSINHMGMFAFIDKLQHSCMPNLDTVAVNNSMALFAMEDIKAGTELTISYLTHYLDEVTSLNKDIRNMQIFLMFQSTCSCILCSIDRKDRLRLAKDKLTDTQREAALKCYTEQNYSIFHISPKNSSKKIFKTLALLSNVKFSEEFKMVYRKLNQLRMYLLGSMLDNTLLSGDY